MWGLCRCLRRPHQTLKCSHPQGPAPRVELLAGPGKVALGRRSTPRWATPLCKLLCYHRTYFLALSGTAGPLRAGVRGPCPGGSPAEVLRPNALCRWQGQRAHRSPPVWHRLERLVLALPKSLSCRLQSPQLS